MSTHGSMAHIAGWTDWVSAMSDLADHDWECEQCSSALLMGKERCSLGADLLAADLSAHRLMTDRRRDLAMEEGSLLGADGAGY